MFSPPSAIDLTASGAGGGTAPLRTDPAALGVDETFVALKSTRLGLSASEATRRQASAERARTDQRRRWSRFSMPQSVQVLVSCAFAQIADPAHLLLLMCAVASATLGAPAMAVAIVALTAVRVLLLAAIDAHCEQALGLLRQARAPRVRVRRDGAVLTISASALAVGEVVELAAGSRVPADLRLFDLTALVIDQTSVQGDDGVAWIHSWVTSGSGAGIVLAAPGDAVGAVLGRLEAQAADAGNASLDDAGTMAPAAATPVSPFVMKFDRANAIVLATAGLILLAGMLRGSGWLHTLLAAVTLATMFWSARDRLAQPLKRLAAAQGAHRLMAAGVYVRGIDDVDRLAHLPADGDAPSVPGAALTTAGNDDTDRARYAADVIFNAPSSEIPRLASLATLAARRAAGGADRAMAFGMPSAIALVVITVVLAVALTPSWPASVPLGLLVLLFGLCVALALMPTDSATLPATRALVALNAHTIDAVWVIALAGAVFAATRLAGNFGVDAATLAFATFAFGASAFAWMVAFEYRREGLRVRRPKLGRPSDAAYLAFGTWLGLSATVAAVHEPPWRSAFETAALTRATWGIAAGLAVAAVALFLAALFAMQRLQRRAGACEKPNQADAAAAPSNAPTDAIAPEASAAATAPVTPTGPPR